MTSDSLLYFCFQSCQISPLTYKTTSQSVKKVKKSHFLFRIKFQAFNITVQFLFFSVICVNTYVL